MDVRVEGLAVGGDGQEALMTASHKLSEALYSQAQEQQQSAASDATDTDDVVEDAEVVEDEDQQDGERR